MLFVQNIIFDWTLFTGKIFFYKLSATCLDGRGCCHEGVVWVDPGCTKRRTGWFRLQHFGSGWGMIMVLVSCTSTHCFCGLFGCIKPDHKLSHQLWVPTVDHIKSTSGQCTSRLGLFWQKQIHNRNCILIAIVFPTNSICCCCLGQRTTTFGDCFAWKMILFCSTSFSESLFTDEKNQDRVHPSNWLAPQWLCLSDRVNKLQSQTTEHRLRVCSHRHHRLWGGFTYSSCSWVKSNEYLISFLLWYVV